MAAKLFVPARLVLLEIDANPVRFFNILRIMYKVIILSGAEPFWCHPFDVKILVTSPVFYSLSNEQNRNFQGCSGPPLGGATELCETLYFSSLV
jgi:hypothetical protein